MADRAYVRETRHGPPIEEQRAAVRPKVERDDLVYVDALPERAAVIKDTRAGSKVVVHSLDRLGTSAGDIRAAVDKLFDKGAGVLDVTAGLVIDANTPRAVQSDAVLAAEKALRRERFKKAQEVAKERRVKVGPKPKPLPADLDKLARQRWHEDRGVSQKTVAAEFGRSVTWLYENYGPRGMPTRRKRNP